VELTGTPKPENYTLDGTSYANVLTSAAKSEPMPLFWHFPGYLGAGGDTWRTTPAGAIRTGDWKLHEFFEDGRLELYNLKDDIGEKHNLAAAQPDKVKELHAQLLAWRDEIKAPMPTKNANIGAPEKKKARKQKLSIEDEAE
jgi:arylsulfatase A-like enzyme